MYHFLSKKGLEFIKKTRRCCLSSYVNEEGDIAIGYGYAKNISPGRTISELTALCLLQSDIMECERLLNEMLMIPLIQHQFDAIFSFFYDIGPGSPGKRSGLAFLKSGTISPMLKLINEAQFQEVGSYFSYWGANGNVEKFHLREAEKKMFLYAEY